MLVNQVRNRLGRDAFTMIEMVIVIAIIAILAGLLLAAVFGVFSTADQAMTKTEITSFVTALGKAQYDLNNVKYLPSKLRLRKDNNYTSANPATQAEYTATKQALQAAFGRNINLTSAPGTTVMNWDGLGPANASTDLVLEGQHCLVFWTGGIPKWDATQTTVTGMLGFATDPTNPTAAPAAGKTRKGPYMVFTQSRLKHDTNFVVYHDTCGKNQPYAYFSAAASPNSYTTTDCNTLGITPYTTGTVGAVTQYASPTGFQIISAGLDGQFGTGGALPATGVGADNLANFQAGRLQLSN